MLSTIYFIFYIYYSFFLPRMNNISRMDWIPSDWAAGVLERYPGSRERWGRGRGCCTFCLGVSMGDHALRERTREQSGKKANDKVSASLKDLSTARKKEPWLKSSETWI